MEEQTEKIKNPETIKAEKEQLPDKEIADMEIAEIAKPAIKSTVSFRKTATDDSATTIKKKSVSMTGTQRQRQVQILVDMAMEKGVHHAVAMAKKIDNAYVLDEFHDSLIDDLYAELKNKRLLDEI